MKGFIQTLKNIWSLQELRDKIIVTLSLILVYRFASYISLPAINMSEVGNLLDHFQKQGGCKHAAGLLGLLSSFTGGAFSHASIMALGIMPYISASIIVQLMGMAIPYLQKLQKDGESGRKTLNQITRWLTIGVCLVQAPFYLGTITQVILPSAVPPIVSGLKVGVGIALMCTISAEMIGSSSGLGYLILTATNLFDTGTTVVGMLVIGLIGLILDYVFGLIEKRVFW